jgi:hypothetical protein
LANIRKELVLSFIKKYHPSTIGDLRRRMEDEGIGSSDEVLQEAVRELQLDGSITVDFRISVDSFPSYIGDPYRNWWIFAVIIASVIEPVLVIDQYTTGPLGLVRAIIGLLLLGYLPGYSTVRVLFPGEQVSPLERILLSIFLSLAVSIAIGVVLGFAYLFTGITSTLGSSIYTVLMTLIAAYREYENQRK